MIIPNVHCIRKKNSECLVNRGQVIVKGQTCKPGQGVCPPLCMFVRVHMHTHQCACGGWDEYVRGLTKLVKRNVDLMLPLAVSVIHLVTGMAHSTRDTGPMGCPMAPVHSLNEAALPSEHKTRGVQVAEGSPGVPSPVVQHRDSFHVRWRAELLSLQQQPADTTSLYPAEVHALQNSPGFQHSIYWKGPTQARCSMPTCRNMIINECEARYHLHRPVLAVSTRRFKPGQYKSAKCRYSSHAL